MTFADYCLEKAEKATPGPWKSDGDGDVWTLAEKEYCPGFDQELFRTIGSTKRGPDTGDAEFIAVARTAVPKLANRLKKACEALDILTTQTRLCLPDDFESREKAIRVLEELVAMPGEEK